MKKFLTTTLFLLFTALLSTAQTITGKVTDEQHAPIPYATIQIGEHYGVVSNMEGEFSIKTSNQPEDAIVAISFMGYETLEIPINEFAEKTYILKQKVNELDEVLVTNKQLTAEEIIELMLEKAPENYDTKLSTHQTFFMRKKTKQKLLDFGFDIEKATEESRRDLKALNKDLEALFEKMKGSNYQYFTEYYGEYIKKTRLDSSKLAIDKYVVLKNEEKDISNEGVMKKVINIAKNHLEKGETYKVKIGMFKVEDSLQVDEIFEEETDSTKGKTKYIKNQIYFKNLNYNTLHEDDDLDFLTKTRRYEYHIDGHTNIDGETAYIISFTPDRGSAMYQGKIYINVFDYGVMRLEYTMLDGEKLHNINMKLLGFKVQEDRIKETRVYQKNKDGKYRIKFGKYQYGAYAYLSLPSFKFIKNREDRSDDKQKLKFEVMLETDVISTTEFYVVHEEEATDDMYTSFENQEFYEPIEIDTYDPSIWEGYNIISPIEDIKNYGKE